MKKKGELSINIIIIAVMALIVLVVMIVVFGNRIGLFASATKSCAGMSGLCCNGDEKFDSGYCQKGVCKANPQSEQAGVKNALWTTIPGTDCPDSVPDRTAEGEIVPDSITNACCKKVW